jgi:hypothetical protein
VTTTPDARSQLDPESARFEAFLAELLGLEPLSDQERRELLECVDIGHPVTALG